MTINGWLQIFVFLALVLAVTKPLGVFMTRVFAGRAHHSGSCAAADRTLALSFNGRRREA